MDRPTVADTIKEITRKHLLEDNGLLYGQCVSAVGWIGGTVPELTEEQGIVELPTSDVAGPAFVMGAALAGRKPIFVCRYQGFMWYNAVTILNYAAKSKKMWGIDCPIFVRGIGMEGSIGPVATGMNHSIIAHMPGINVLAPMTPKEWESTWEMFKIHKEPVYCSEHRLSFNNSEEMPDIDNGSDITIVGIGAARLVIRELSKERNDFNVVNAFRIKPLVLPCSIFARSKRVLIVDSDYTTCGISEHIAYMIQKWYKIPSTVIGLEDKTAGFAEKTDNKTPSKERILEYV